MTSPNTFQEQLIDYLSGTTGGYIGATGSRLESTTSNVFAVGYQGPDTPSSGTGGISCGWEIRADPTSGVVYMDSHTTPGFVVNNFDTRTIYGGGATGSNGLGQAVFEGAAYTYYCPLRTNPPGASLPPNWFLDYGEVVVADGLNQLTTITFNTTFPSAPKVIVQVVDTGPGTQVDNFTTYIEATSTTTCSVRGFGSVSTGFKYNWIAIGGV